MIVAIPLLLLALYATVGLHFVFHNDVMQFMIPKLSIMQKEMRAGQLPFWNPYEGCGTVLLAEGAKPVVESLLLLVLPVKDMLMVTAAIHVLLGMLFFFGFARQIGLSPRAALLGAVIWTFNGYHAWFMNDLALFGTNLFLPLLMLCYLRFVRPGTVGGKGGPAPRRGLWLLAAAGAAGAQLLYARPTDLIYAWAVLAGFIVYDQVWPLGQDPQGIRGSCAWQGHLAPANLKCPDQPTGETPVGRMATLAMPRNNTRSIARSVAFLAATVGMGLLLAMFFVLPYAKSISRSARFSDVREESLYVYPVSAAELLVPNIAQAARSRMGSLLPDWGGRKPFHSRGYFGLAALPLMLLSWRARNRFKAFFLVIAAAGLACVFPLKLFDLLRLLPLHHGAVETMRLVVPFMLGAAVLAGAGYDRLFPPADEDEDRKVRWFISLRACMIVETAALVALFVLGFLSHRSMLGPMIVVVVSAIAVGAVSLAWQGRVGQTAAFRVLLASLIITCFVASLSDPNDGDLWAKNHRYEHDVPNMPAVQFLEDAQRQGPARVAVLGRPDGSLDPHWSSWQRFFIPTLSYYQPAPAAAMVHFLCPGAKGRDQVRPYLDANELGMYSLASAQYIVAPAAADANALQQAGLERCPPAGPFAVFRNPRALPRFRFVDSWQVIPDANLALHFIRDKAERDLSWFTHNTVLEQPIDLASAERRPPVQAATMPAVPSIIALDNGGNEVRFAAHSPHDALLVMDDAFDPGWRATVNGQDVPVYRADYLFRAVAVPAGKSTVCFSYCPPGFTSGCMISGVTMAVMLIMAGGLLLRRRSRPSAVAN